MDLAYEVDGNIVLLGEVAEVAHDQFETPVATYWGQYHCQPNRYPLKGGRFEASLTSSSV